MANLKIQRMGVDSFRIDSDPPKATTYFIYYGSNDSDISMGDASMIQQNGSISWKVTANSFQEGLDIVAEICKYLAKSSVTVYSCEGKELT